MHPRVRIIAELPKPLNRQPHALNSGVDPDLPFALVMILPDRVREAPGFVSIDTQPMIAQSP